MSEARRLVDKLWSYCDVLRDDGVGVIEYTEENDPFQASSPAFRDYIDQNFPGPKLTPWIETAEAPVLPAASTTTRPESSDRK